MSLRLEEDPQTSVDNTANAPIKSVLLATALATPGISIHPLRDRLRKEGYDAHTVYPHSFLNLGLGSANAVKDAAKKLRDRNGGEPIAGIGWRLGGRQL